MSLTIKKMWQRRVFGIGFRLERSVNEAGTTLDVEAF